MRFGLLHSMVFGQTMVQEKVWLHFNLQVTEFDMVLDYFYHVIRPEFLQTNLTL